MKLLLTIFSLLLVSGTIFAQELDIKVSVSSPANANADPKVFERLETEITELLNNTKWTEDEFQDHEKIQGQIAITITKEVSTTAFEAELSVISARPVFNSTYTSQLIKYLDRNVSFSYDGVRPIQKSENNYIDPLSSIITFYAYYIIGMDYDSFSPNGGEPYFDKAYDVFESLPSAIQRGDQGWTSDNLSQQNRYFLIENVRNPSLAPFRGAFYEYHRMALDKMHEDPEKSRAVLLSTLTQIGENDKNYPRSILIRMFSDAKELEIVDIFKAGSAGEKSKVKKIMSAINPTKSSAYRNLN